MEYDFWRFLSSVIGGVLGAAIGTYILHKLQDRYLH